MGWFAPTRKKSVVTFFFQNERESDGGEAELQLVRAEAQVLHRRGRPHRGQRKDLRGFHLLRRKYSLLVVKQKG